MINYIKYSCQPDSTGCYFFTLKVGSSLKKTLAKLIGILPQNKISKIVGSASKSKLSRYLIPLYIKKYNINTEEIEKPVHKFENLNQFFIRRLKNGERVINNEPNSIVSPVDGTISEFGYINSGSIIQAKGITYSVSDLLGERHKEEFQEGSYLVIYLSPRNYHRIHSPFDSSITSFEYIPGKLYPVNQLGVHHVDGLFTKNERLTTYFKANKGIAALTKVGAFIVGSIQISYHDNVHETHRGNPYRKEFEKPLSVEKGTELGRFEFGSTIILLLDKNAGKFDEKALVRGREVKLGERLGVLNV